MASTGPLINLLVTVPRVLITKGINVSFMFHSLKLPSKVQVLFLLFTFFQFYSLVSRDSKVHKFASFLLIIIRSGHLAEIKRSIHISKSKGSLCMSFSRTDAGLYIYNFFVWSNLNFLHNSYWITLSIQSCLVLNSFSVNLLHSLIRWLMVSSLLLFHRYYY